MILQTTNEGASSMRILNTAKPIINKPDISSLPIPLPSDPTLPMHAATKQYVDNQVSAVDSLARSKVSKSGDTVTGPLVLQYTPTRHKGDATGWSSWSGVVSFKTVDMLGWVATLGGSRNDHFNSSSVSVEGGSTYVYAVGYERSSGSNYDALISKWNASGQITQGTLAGIPQLSLADGDLTVGNPALIVGNPDLAVGNPNLTRVYSAY